VKSTTTGETTQLHVQPITGGPPRKRPSAPWWLIALLAGIVASLWITWPLPVHMTELWSVRLPGSLQLGASPMGAFSGNDALQTMHVNRVVIDNLLHLREPFVDSTSGVGGPEPLRTTSLDVPWSLVMAAVMPLAGLVAAYNATLLLSGVATVLAAFGLLRRHTRFPLLALAAALAYALVPGRVFQLSLHFNAVMWWAFPAAAWALEAMLDRHRSGGRWLVPGAWLVAVTLTVGLSGEYHHALYLSGMVGFLAAWWAVQAAIERRPIPIGPLALAVGAVVVADAYVFASFKWVFGSGVAGTNGQYGEAIRYAPFGLGALVHKNPGELGEGLIYLGWPLALLAFGGLVAVVAVRARRRSRELAYAVLTLPVLFLTLGPAADRAIQRGLDAVGLSTAFEPYRRVFQLLPFLQLQRVSARLLVLAALLLVLLAMVALDAAASWAIGPTRGTGVDGLPGLSTRPRRPRAVAAIGAVALVLGTVWLLNDYKVFRAVLRPSYTDNRVVAALHTSGDGAGPFVGLPAYGQTFPWNAASTYLASQTGRRTLNAYNQSSSSWLDDRAAVLAPLNQGDPDPAAIAALRKTGTRQLVVVDESHVYCCGRNWHQVVDKLVASGQFRLVVDDAPFALLELNS
jgi:hypothetical protein